MVGKIITYNHQSNKSVSLLSGKENTQVFQMAMRQRRRISSQIYEYPVLHPHTVKLHHILNNSSGPEKANSHCPVLIMTTSQDFN